MINYGCRPVWIEIDSDAIAHNVKEIKKHIGNHKGIIGVIKGDAYGHGSIEVARILINSGVNYLAVATIDEGVELREHQIDVPVLVLGYTCKEQVQEAVDYNLTLSVFHKEIAQKISRYASTKKIVAKVHIKVNTGMNRLGIPSEDIKDFVNFLQSLNGIKIEGVFTHFASAAQKDKTDANVQFHKFEHALQKIEKQIENPFIIHAANSGATMDMPYSHFDAVRPGRLLYGLYPYPEVPQILQLRRALSMRAKIIQINRIKAGESIGYENVFKPKYDTYTATLPLGFTDGIVSKMTTDQVFVILKGEKRQVVAVCADMCMIEIGPTLDNILEGDTVTLIGEQDNKVIYVEDVALPSQQSLGGVFTHLNRRLPRIYFKNGEPYLVKKPFEKYIYL